MSANTATPLADLLDAHVAAHHAGVQDAEVALLMEIGEDIAKFAIQLHEKFGRLTTGAMGTAGSCAAGPAKHAYQFDEPQQFAAFLVTVFDEDSYGYSLDAQAVIAAAVALQFDPATAQVGNA